MMDTPAKPAAEVKATFDNYSDETRCAQTATMKMVTQTVRCVFKFNRHHRRVSKTLSR